MTAPASGGSANAGAAPATSHAPTSHPIAHDQRFVITLDPGRTRPRAGAAVALRPPRSGAGVVYGSARGGGCPGRSSAGPAVDDLAGVAALELRGVERLHGRPV